MKDLTHYFTNSTKKSASSNTSFEEDPKPQPNNDEKEISGKTANNFTEKLKRSDLDKNEKRSLKKESARRTSEKHDEKSKKSSRQEKTKSKDKGSQKHDDQSRKLSSSEKSKSSSKEKDESKKLSESRKQDDKSEKKSSKEKDSCDKSSMTPKHDSKIMKYSRPEKLKPLSSDKKEDVSHKASTSQEHSPLEKVQPSSSEVESPSTVRKPATKPDEDEVKLECATVPPEETSIEVCEEQNKQVDSTNCPIVNGKDPAPLTPNGDIVVASKARNVFSMMMISSAKKITPDSPNDEPKNKNSKRSLSLKHSEKGGVKRSKTSGKSFDANDSYQSADKRQTAKEKPTSEEGQTECPEEADPKAGLEKDEVMEVDQDVAPVSSANLTLSDGQQEAEKLEEVNQNEKKIPAQDDQPVIEKSVADKVLTDSDDEIFKSNPKKKKRNKRRLESSDEEKEYNASSSVKTPAVAQPVITSTKSSGLYSYFSPVSKQASLEKTNVALSGKKVAAEVHHLPSPPEQVVKKAVGPTRRSLRSRKADEDEIIVIEEIKQEVPTAPEPVRKKQSKPWSFKTPEKKKRRRPWQLKVRLLSPAKPPESASDSSTGSDSDSDYSYHSPDQKRLAASKLDKKNCPLAPIFMRKQRGQLNLEPETERGAQKKTPRPDPKPIRAAPTEHTLGFVDVDPNTPLSVMYPSISHITQRTTDETTPKNSTQTVDCETEQAAPNCPPVVPGCLMTSEASSSEKSVDRSSIRRNKDDAESWCEKFRPKCASEISGNAASVQKLKAWLEGWKQQRTQGETKKQSDSESSDYDTDSFIVSSDEDESGKKQKKKKKKRCNMAIIVGPPGSGKTAAVFALAEELGFKVLEMNASSRRSGKKILSELQEATQSHQVRSNNVVDRETLNAFFSGAKAKQRGKKSESKYQSQSTASENSNAGLSLILVEDVDVVFEEQDEGFLAALNVLAASSKRPLILVSNDPQIHLLFSQQYQLFLEFGKVPASQTAPALQQMCEIEGEEVCRGQLGQLLMLSKGDLRRAVLLAQMWNLSGGFPKQYTSDELPYPLDLPGVWLGMGRTPLPYISSDQEPVDVEITVHAANNTWDWDSEDDSNSLLNPKSRKSQIIRQRLTSESIDAWEPTQEAVWPADLKKLIFLTDMLASLDILQGHSRSPAFSEPRPGLSDACCQDSPANNLSSPLQHYLASNVLRVSGCKLAQYNLETSERWQHLHKRTDQDLLHQLNFIHLDRRSVALDILPVLREIGRYEQVSGRSSRRSKINGLQSIGIIADTNSLEALPFIFPSFGEEASEVESHTDHAVEK